MLPAEKTWTIRVLVSAGKSPAITLRKENQCV